jgi:HD superfamily phosphohydrolase
MEIYSTRLAGLFHDVGHGPFSHVTEALLRSHFASEFARAEQMLRQSFDGVTKIATSETIAVLIVLSNSVRQVFEHPRFGIAPAAELAPAIAAHILGSRSCLTATYLSGVVSGPLDADKIDYMARDSHHSGLPIGLDMNRLISKLEVIIVTPQNALNPELRERALSAPNQRFYEMGISLSGLGAYEQMIIGRVILYDRLYYHHKVRAAESMVRSLVRIVGEETRPLQFHELITTNLR